MSANNTQQPVELSWLKEHPRQPEFFGEIPQSELNELAADLQQRGQQEPIHCLPDGTLVRGHRRVAAAQRLGWTTIEAVIREDLANATDEEIVEELVLDNLVRRQLDDLTLARCYRQLKRSIGRSGANGGDVRDRLAARLNCGKSGRSLDRLERLLDLPIEVQHAISRGTLNKSHGEKILRLAPETQAELAQALRDGVPVRQVLRDYGVVEPRREKNAPELGQELLAFLAGNTGRLQRHLKKLDRVQVGGGKALEVLDEAVEFLIQWRDRKRALHQESLDAIRPACVGFRRRMK